MPDQLTRRCPRALVVEDDAGIQHLIETIVNKRFEVTCAGDGAEALEALAEARFDLIVLDLMLPKVSGLVVAEEVRHLDGPVQLVILSAVAKQFSDTFADGVVVLEKPFGIARLKTIVEEVAARSA